MSEAFDAIDRCLGVGCTLQVYRAGIPSKIHALLIWGTRSEVVAHGGSISEALGNLNERLSKPNDKSSESGGRTQTNYLPQLAKLKGIIARNAMQRLKGEDATEMHITPDDINDSLEVLYEYQRNHQDAKTQAPANPTL